MFPAQMPGNYRDSCDVSQGGDLHQHEILHEQAAKQRGGRPSPAHVQINGSVKETIALLPSALHLSGKWKAAVSPQEKVTL